MHFQDWESSTKQENNKTTTTIPWEIWESSPKIYYYQADVQNTPKPVKSQAKDRTEHWTFKSLKGMELKKMHKKEWKWTI